MIDSDGGSLSEYLASMTQLIVECQSGSYTTLCSGHGPACGRPHDYLRRYLDHRLSRVDAVRAQLQAGNREPAGIAAVLYPGLSAALMDGAEMNVAATIRFLTTPGTLEVAEASTPAAELDQ